VIKRPEENPVLAVVTTKAPESYQYYFEGLGLKTDVVDSNVIVWRRGIAEKERSKVMGKLKQVI
jgi:hypothetical protein